MVSNFEDIASYLPMGSARQREAYRVLCTHRIMERLREFDPLLAGTIPIGIDIPGSDLDILCHYRDGEGFTTLLHSLFGVYESFSCHSRGTAVVASFRIESFEIEAFGDCVPTREQNGWRHMLIEHALLERHGEPFRSQIIALKLAGLKTEPAFACLLGLPGDPYQAMLALDLEE